MRHFARFNLSNLAQQVDIYMNLETYTETEGSLIPRISGLVANIAQMLQLGA